MPDIHKIKKATPSHKDRYFVDTNVWFWFTYCSSKEIYNECAPKRYQTDQYPEFIEKVLDTGAKLYHCPLIYSELANVIERTEYEIYKIQNSNPTISRKEFRAIAEQRQTFVRELNQAWKTISELSNCLEVMLNNDLIRSANSVIENSCLDPYDAFYLNIMQSEGINKIITDDKDFLSTNVESLYTANNNV